MGYYFQASVSRGADTLQRCQAQLEGAEARASSADDAVRIKVAMLDSANDTIADLKAEMGDLQGEVAEARVVAEEAEAALMVSKAR